MGSVDPTYPFYPIACIASAALLLLVLLTSRIRKSWNLGVASLCFWLVLENLVLGVNAIIWADNSDVKYYVYCDIASRVQVIAYVVKPMATLIITRQLHLITSRRLVGSADKKAKRLNVIIEWTLSSGIPLTVAGPIFYVVQVCRFQVLEGFGCTNAGDGSILDILLLWSWSVTIPLLSIAMYYFRVVTRIYRQARLTKLFLDNGRTTSRNTYLRLIALASFDILITLPIGVSSIVLTVTSSLDQGPIPFYFGWTDDHNDWQPQSVPYADLKASGTFTLAQAYFTRWAAPVFGFVMFGLVGVTTEARASYWRIVCKVGGRVGWTPKPRRHEGNSTLGTMEFGSRPQVQTGDTENRRQADTSVATTSIETSARSPRYDVAVRVLEKDTNSERLDAVRRVESEVAS